MSKHTPGPWRCSVGSDLVRIKRIGELEVKAVKYASETDIPVALVVKYSAEPSESDANARLIAAAPDLLEACKEIVGMLDRGDLVRPTGGDGDPDWVLRMMKFVPRIKKLSDAVNKAEGK